MLNFLLNLFVEEDENAKKLAVMSAVGPIALVPVAQIAAQRHIRIREDLIVHRAQNEKRLCSNGDDSSHKSDVKP